MQLSKKQKYNWSKNEDELLISLVNSSKFTNYGRIQWESIAKELNQQLHLHDSYIRLSKHCRERWVNHLNPEMKRDKWTLKEDYNLFEKYMEYPQKWSKISKILKGRTDNSIKNRFNKLIKLDKLKKSLYDKDANEEIFEKLKKLFFQAKENLLRQLNESSTDETHLQIKKLEEKKEDEENQKIEELNEEKLSIEKESETQKNYSVEKEEKPVKPENQMMKTENLKRNLTLKYNYEEEFKWKRFLHEIEEINIYAKRDYFYC